ncbi:two-component system sensor histidine kinase NtrB [Natranaerofaba carboxydovora]|uniref:two-component system sensor histidine kinase NtrB n=1 Tax=Natranaerofaba carboxydovora TaxID=2742683 RepID=UPI001F145D4C|nr:ATP-binding protein [Natranaerofaba carboxydovora]UMZ73784.1 Sensor kinase CckA [Natranaerofaba carboxydovora]
MVYSEENIQDLKDLRKKAESVINTNSNEVLNEITEYLHEQDSKEIIKELKLHQVELEMQNEELRRTQSELKKTQAHYYDLFEKAPVGYLKLDKNGIIEEANSASTKILQVEKNKLIKQPLNRFVDFYDQDKYYFTRRKSLETGEKQVCELRMVGRVESDDELWVQMEIKPECVVLIDISERKKLEKIEKTFNEYKYRADKFESFGVMARGIAHDFNNYLAVLLANLSYIIQYKNKPDKISKNLNNMEMVINKAKDITKKLQILARGEEPIKEVSYVNEIINDSAYLAFNNTKITSNIMLPDDLYPVKIDKEQIYQVFYNIFFNATQAMPEGGTTWVKGENIYLTEKESQNIVPLPEGDYLKITITDNGPGITDENLQKIFDPFFTTKAEGSGLGLSTAYSIIESHEGCIKAESEKNKGTSFIIYLPAHES